VRSLWLLGLAMACRGGSTPGRDASAHRARDAALAPSIDAPIADAARTCDTPTHTFRFGTLSAPPGWCWHRTAEGDDLSGVVVDAQGRVRLRWDELAFDAKVDDACDPKRRGVHDVHDLLAQGVPYRTCMLADGHRCWSFRGLANVCAEPGMELGVDPIGTLVPRRATVR
jgi:hypothetical protein